MVRSVQGLWEGVGQWISGKWRKAKTRKLAHSKKLRMKEIPVEFRYKFENGDPDKRGRLSTKNEQVL
jgi:hypothetical protein